MKIKLPGLFFVLVFSLSLSGMSQQKHDSLVVSRAELVGVWQVNSYLVTSGLKDNFQFYKDGTFVFNTDSYNNLNTVMSIVGKYILKNRILSLRVEYITQLTNFTVVGSESAFQFGPFRLDGGKLSTIVQKDTSYSIHEIYRMSDPKKSTKVVIRLDSDKYYKISSDPSEYSGKPSRSKK